MLSQAVHFPSVALLSSTPLLQHVRTVRWVMRLSAELVAVDIGSGPAIGARKDPRSAPCIGADLSPYGWPVLTQQYLPLLATFPGLNFDGYR